MKTIPLNSGEEQIRNFVLEWNELLALEKYAEAIDFILYDNTQIIDGKPWIWTPEKLEASVYTYGMPWFSREEIEKEYGPGSADYKVTSLLNSPDKEELLSDISITVDYYTVTSEKAALWGLEKTDYENIIGDVHYDGVPLNGSSSDLTAIFYIQKVDNENITLLFHDLHVM